MPRTWPEDWEERKRGRDCPMCSEGRPERTEGGARVFTGERSDAYLVDRDWVRGYTIVIWRGEHVSEITELDDAEAADFWKDVRRVGAAIERHFQPAKLNIHILGNTVPHLHAHLLPRYLDDPAPGKPLPWYTGGRVPIAGDVFDRDVAALRGLLQDR